MYVVCAFYAFSFSLLASFSLRSVAMPSSASTKFFGRIFRSFRRWGIYPSVGWISSLVGLPPAINLPGVTLLPSLAIHPPRSSLPTAGKPDLAFLLAFTYSPNCNPQGYNTTTSLLALSPPTLPLPCLISWQQLRWLVSAVVATPPLPPDTHTFPGRPCCRALYLPDS